MWGIAVSFSYFFGITLGLGLLGVWLAQGMDEWVRGPETLGFTALVEEKISDRSRESNGLRELKLEENLKWFSSSF